MFKLITQAGSFRLITILVVIFSCKDINREFVLLTQDLSLYRLPIAGYVGVLIYSVMLPDARWTHW